MAWVFISGMLGGDVSNEESEYAVDVGMIAKDAIQRYDFAGRQVYIVSNDEATADCLQRNAAFLYDAAPVRRADVQNKKFIVIYAHEPELGCPLEFVPSDTLTKSKYPLATEVDWCGGFRDVCRGSLYDLAGRVFANQGGILNLRNAHYRVTSDRLFISMKSVN